MILKTARGMQEKHIKGAYHRNIGMGPKFPSKAEKNNRMAG